MSVDSYHESVSEYYGKTVKKTTDLKYDACISTGSKKRHHREILAKVHPHVIASYYGCGTPVPDPLEGTVVVDLGSGTGKDCFLISALSGKTGKVIGVDMTPEQIEIAVNAIPYHKEHIPEASEIEFRHGFIEDLHTANIEDETVDIVISNCVVNLSNDKKSVFKEIFRVLKVGGEVHISDVFSDRNLPQKAREDKVLVGECIGNALSLTTFIALMDIAGFKDLRAVECRKISLPEFPEDLIERGTVFYSITFSSFKGIPSSKWEHDIAVYKGGVPGSEEVFDLDMDHSFAKGNPVPIMSDIAFILKTPRYQKYFEFSKDENANLPQQTRDFLTSVMETQNYGDLCSGACCGPNSKSPKPCCEGNQCCQGEKCCEGQKCCEGNMCCQGEKCCQGQKCCEGNQCCQEEKCCQPVPK